LAAIDSYGLLTAFAPGKVTIKATAWDGSGVTGTLDIFISDILAESITVSSENDKDSIYVRDTLRMNALVLPADATNPTYTWSLIPEGLAEINSNGRLIATAQGQVTVIATANDGSGVYGSFDITIIEKVIGGLNAIGFGKIAIYPNPVINGNFTISGIENINLIELIDLSGTKLAEFSNYYQPSINLYLNISPGIYILKLSDGKQSDYKKITVY
jgi:hypothetical protein